MDIAIVGAACRLPGAADLGALSDLLFASRDAVTEIPKERWTKRLFLDADAQQLGKSYTFAAGCLDAVDQFDAAFFGMSPREAMHTDPQQRLMLELAYEAFEDAGLRPSAAAGRDMAVFIGASGWEYSTLKVGDVSLMDAHSMQGLSLSSLSNRLSFVFDLKGPSLTVDTACSSSLVALHLGCQAIERGDASSALVGAVNMLLSPQNFVGFSRASMLSPTGRCHAFDARADGYVRAEGGGVVLLKPLRDAIADGDDIRAVIRGVAVNSDGHTSSFSVPGQDAQAGLLKATYAAAGVAPESLSYLEAHGTGTPVGDPIEAAALGAGLGSVRSRPLPIGSIKTNVGHLEAASGIAGLMKLLIAFDRKEVPPSLHCETPNPNIPFEALNLILTPKARPLEYGPEGAFVGINSFGFGGTNAHAILSSPPRVEPALVDRSPPNVQANLPLLLSARSEGALRDLARAWSKRLRGETVEGAAALARAVARRRDLSEHRLAVTAGPPNAVAASLETWLAGSETKAVTVDRASEGGVAFIFSGNGSQWAGMGADAYALNKAFREAVDEIDLSFVPLAGWSLAARFQNGGDEGDLENALIAQPLLFALQVGAVTALKAAGVQPAAVVGHSVGEAAAAWASGALTLAQATEVIFHRSRLQGSTRGQGGMAALSLGLAEARVLIAEVDARLEIAAENAPDSVTVAGPSEALDKLRAEARARRRVFLRLPVDYAFHSAAMDPLKAPLGSALRHLEPGRPTTLMVSTTTGQTVADGELSADYWWRNVRAPVRFSEAVDQLIGAGVRNFLEVGPRPVLQTYLNAILKRGETGGAVLGTLNNKRATTDPFSPIALRCFAAGSDITQGEAFDGPSLVRGLPGYPWQRQVHWLGSTTEAVRLVDPSDDHPLLGFRQDAGRMWSNVLSASRMPWVADHVIDGTPVVPGSALIDAALAAARVRRPDDTALEIDDIELVRPLLVDGARDLKFDFVSNDRFELSSRTRLSHDDPAVCARGRVVPAPTATPLLPRTDRGRTPKVMTGEAFYQRIDHLEMSYGAEFRVIERVLVYSPEEVEVQFSARSNPLEPGWLIDPRILDGAFQALFATRGLDFTTVGDTVMPWRFGRARLLKPDSEPVSARCHLKRTAPKAHLADIALLDAQGDVVAEFLHCWFVRLRPGSAEQAENAFHRAMTPCARQPIGRRSGQALPALQPGATSEPEANSGEVLGHAYATAVAYELFRSLVGDDNLLSREGLLLSGRLSRDSTHLFDVLLDWLILDELALPRGRGAWWIDPDSALPPADSIWQSLVFDEPEAVAETALAAIAASGLAEALQSGHLELPHSLSRQLMESSPTIRASTAMVGDVVMQIIREWPASYPLRIALVGVPSSSLVRELLARIGGRGSDVSVKVLGVDGLSPTVLAELRSRAGTQVVEGPDALVSLDGFDLVVAAFSQSAGIATPDVLAGLLVPGGHLVAIEAETSRFWTLAMGLEATMAHSVAWRERLATAGLETSATALGGVVWPARLIVGRKAASTAPALRRPNHVTVFADNPSPVAKALAACADRAIRRPSDLSAMLSQDPPEGGRDLLFIPSPATDLAGLAGYCGEIAKQVGVMASSEGARVWLLVYGDENDPATLAIAGLRRVMTNEGVDARFLCVAPGLSAERLLSEIASADEEREIFLSAEGRRAPRLRIGLPQADWSHSACRLEITKPGLLGSLCWEDFEPAAPGPGQVSIKVAASGLNFRDVMWALGILPDEALMDGFSGPTLGLECAGVVTAVGEGVDAIGPGDRVAALAPAALATHVTTSAQVVLPLPDTISFAAAATLPVTILTVTYALGRLAQIRPGERVLIHGALGGVGLAAVQYAKHRGAVIYATAGSPERRILLRAMGVEHVFDSRTSDFADAILAATSGEGVDVVLNSLSGELMHRSLELLRPFGRFLEIGKRDLFANSEIGLRSLRHNATYFAIDADQLPMLRPDIAKDLLEEATELLRIGAMRPLPYRTFAGADAIEAFRTMQGSSHVGKIVILPESRTAPAPSKAHQFRVRVDRTYVVTGGTGGFGLETARWLADQGVLSLALLSRRGPSTPGIEEALNELASRGVDARAYACDVAQEHDLSATLAAMRAAQAPLGGVFHAAMVMDDGLLADLGPERFERSLQPKLAGAELLDRLTRADPIELFVLFSSISAAVGNPGQGNYVVANAAMEAIALGRAALGLPALAVQWGPISDAGFLERDTRIRELLERVLASGELTARAALGALPRLIESGLPVVGYAVADWAALRRQIPVGHTTLLSEISQERVDRALETSVRDQVITLPAEEGLLLVESFLADEVSAILRLDRAKIDVEQPISSMGFDSLMTLELHLAVESRLGCELSLMSVGGAASLRSIATRVVRSLRGEIRDDQEEIHDRLRRHGMEEVRLQPQLEAGE